MTQQISFDPFDYVVELTIPLTAQRDDQHRLAKADRDAKYHELRGMGRNVTRFTLRNQLEKYQSFGVAGRGYRHVYYVQENS